MARYPANKQSEGGTAAEPVTDNNQDNSGIQPDQSITTNEQVTAKSNMVKIKNERLKGKGLFISDGTLVRFDDDGVAEFDKKEAARLLSIPGYVKV